MHDDCQYPYLIKFLLVIFHLCPPHSSSWLQISSCLFCVWNWAQFHTEVSLPYCSSSNKICLVTYQVPGAKFILYTNAKKVQIESSEITASHSWIHGRYSLFLLPCRQGTGPWLRFSIEFYLWANPWRINSGSGNKITQEIHRRKRSQPQSRACLVTMMYQNWSHGYF